MDFKKLSVAAASLAVAVSMTAYAQDNKPVQSTSSTNSSAQMISVAGSGAGSIAEASSETSSETASKPSEPEAEKIPLTSAELEQLEKDLFFADLSLDRKLFDAYNDYDIKAVLKSPK